SAMCTSHRAGKRLPWRRWCAIRSRALCAASATAASRSGNSAPSGSGMNSDPLNMLMKKRIRSSAKGVYLAPTHIKDRKVLGQAPLTVVEVGVALAPEDHGTQSGAQLAGNRVSE